MNNTDIISHCFKKFWTLETFHSQTELLFLLI